MENSTTNNKRQYRLPIIERIELDNEISLALESAPPTGPDESYNQSLPSGAGANPFTNSI